MKEWRRVLSCFLAVLLTVYLVPVQVMAEELGDLWPPTTENVVDAPADVVGEILEQREENRKEFLLTDGTRQVVIYPAAVHYQKMDIGRKLTTGCCRLLRRMVKPCIETQPVCGMSLFLLS